MNVLDLFSGIGGFSLGLERAGMRTVAFCEIDPYCRAVLRKYWPDTPIFDDVRTLDGQSFRNVQVICGGFPCQDISSAGAKVGIEGERSGLWREYARIIGEVRPRYVIVENVADLLSRGLGIVLGDLAALGYDAEWHCIPASALGAPHRRDRLWLIAYTDGERQSRRSQPEVRSVKPKFGPSFWNDIVRFRAAMADTDAQGCDQSIGTSEEISRAGARQSAGPLSGGRHPWIFEPDVGRVANGISSRVDRLAALGNAVIPQIPEIIGRAIMNARSLSSPKNKGTL